MPSSSRLRKASPGWNSGTPRYCEHLIPFRASHLPPTSLLPPEDYGSKKLIFHSFFVPTMCQVLRQRKQFPSSFPFALSFCGSTIQTPLPLLSFRDTYSTTEIWQWLKLESGHCKKYKSEASSHLPPFVITTTIRATVSQKLILCARHSIYNFASLTSLNHYNDPMRQVGFYQETKAQSTEITCPQTHSYSGGRNWI